jgi:hypothetical protein
MAELGLFDLLFAAIPDGIENVTFANFKRLWRFYGMGRLHACRIEASDQPLSTSNPYNLAHEHAGPGSEDYRLFTHDLYRSVTERLLVVETLEQRIWGVYMLYTIFITQSPPPGRHHEQILLPQNVWPVMERCRSDFFRLRLLSDPRKILAFLLTNNCFTYALDAHIFPHSGLELDVRGDREPAYVDTAAARRRRVELFDLRSTPAPVAGSVRPLFVVADALDRALLGPRPRELGAVLHVSSASSSSAAAGAGAGAQLRRRAVAYERELLSVLGPRTAAAIHTAVVGAEAAAETGTSFKAAAAAAAAAAASPRGAADADAYTKIIAADAASAVEAARQVAREAAVLTSVEAFLGPRVPLPPAPEGSLDAAQSAQGAAAQDSAAMSRDGASMTHTPVRAQGQAQDSQADASQQQQQQQQQPAPPPAEAPFLPTHAELIIAETAAELEGVAAATDQAVALLLDTVLRPLPPAVLPRSAAARAVYKRQWTRARRAAERTERERADVGSVLEDSEGPEGSDDDGRPGRFMGDTDNEEEQGKEG